LFLLRGYASEFSSVSCIKRSISDRSLSMEEKSCGHSPGGKSKDKIQNKGKMKGADGFFMQDFLLF
jgi:hypothetical protein